MKKNSSNRCLLCRGDGFVLVHRTGKRVCVKCVIGAMKMFIDRLESVAQNQAKKS